jgi:hypothetical protein
MALWGVACSAPPKKEVDNPTGSDTPDACCCKSTPMTSEDGKPIFERINRMECSTKQGECVFDVQCGGSGR